MSYESFFGLDREPFAVAPDPHFLYMSEKHREALAYLMYGLKRGGGFVLLTGEIGAGKTTIWRCFLQQLPANFDVAYIVNPKLGVEALLARVCEELRVDQPAAQLATTGAGAGEADRDGVADTVPLADPIDAIHGHLMLAYARGRRTLIVVDEAQALSSEVLEQLRLLTNLVTSDRKLVQMVLIGQPELRNMLEAPALEPVAQRVVARFHLPALSEPDTVGYVVHRLRVAGLQGPVPFDSDALGEVHRLCGGVPRRINVLCDRALFGAHAAGSARVTRAMVERAAGEVFGLRRRAAPAAPPPLATVPGVPGPSVWPRRFALAGMAAAAAFAGVAVAPTLTRLASGGLRAGIVLDGAAASSGVTSTVAVAAAAAPPAASSAARVAATATPGAAAPVGPARPEVGSVTTATAATAAVAPPAAPVDLPVRLDSLEPLFAPGAGDESAAWRNLAGLWNVSLARGDACALAAQQALHCFRSRGGLGPIRQLGRPGIIRLADERGRVAHVLLLGLGDESALLRASGQDRSVPLALLARAWHGEFATFWRTPPGYAEGEVVASGGPLAPWLSQQLARVDAGASGRPADGMAPGPPGDATTPGRPADAATADGAAASPPLDDAALRARVFAFQLARGLEPDGLAGPLTLMQLNRASGVAEPRLLYRR